MYTPHVQEVYSQGQELLFHQEQGQSVTVSISPVILDNLCKSFWVLLWP
jgi:hypothetical protein